MNEKLMNRTYNFNFFLSIWEAGMEPTVIVQQYIKSEVFGVSSHFSAFASGAEKKNDSMSRMSHMVTIKLPFFFFFFDAKIQH